MNLYIYLYINLNIILYIYIYMSCFYFYFNKIYDFFNKFLKLSNNEKEKINSFNNLNETRINIASDWEDIN